jgi:hypothetical protein
MGYKLYVRSDLWEGIGLPNTRFFYETEEDGSVSNVSDLYSRLLYFIRDQDTDYRHLRIMAICPIPSRLTWGGTINWATTASLNILSLDQILQHETKILIQFRFIHIFNLLFSVSNSHVKLTVNKQMHFWIKVPGVISAGVSSLEDLSACKPGFS